MVFNSCSKVCVSHPSEWSEQTCKKVDIALYYVFLGSMLATAAVAGSIIGAGASAGLATAAGFVAFKALSDHVTTKLTESYLIRAIANLAAFYLGFYVGTAVLMNAAMLAKPLALNMAFTIIASTMIAGHLTRSATLDLQKMYRPAEP